MGGGFLNSRQFQNVEKKVNESVVYQNEIPAEKLLKYGIKSINPILVKHCTYSYGFSIVLSTELKIVYSGDCTYDKNLIRLGADADFLINESSFSDD